MQISATYNDEIVNIVNVQGDGNNVYVTYVDSSDILRLSKTWWDLGGGGDSSLYIASGSVIV